MGDDLPMTVKRLPYAIKSKNPLYVEALLQELLNCKERDRLHAVALVGATEDDRLVMKMAGRYVFFPKDANWAIDELKDEVRKFRAR